jgi:PilZ domain
MAAVEQRQYPRFGLGLPVQLVFAGRGQTVSGELQDISRGGCFFKSTAVVDVDRRISVVFSVSSGKTCRASGRVVRTVAYRGFAVLFDEEAEQVGIAEVIRDIAPLTQERRADFLRDILNPQIEIR